ncbi:LysR family transcriptional regulator [Kitasatospora sp. NPDC089797]|uniref:LysR family transcriptional regulator n=1 Tax=Kitasatospora sp. NPDC089797 TaxID=3155298 RepID=UPI00341AC930
MSTPSGSKLSLRQLEYLVATVEEGRLTRAAQRLHVTEPTLSQQLRALERAVGARLLVRGADGARPTPAGEAFLPHARRALHSAERARAEARSAEAGCGRILRVAVPPSYLPGLLPALAVWARADTGTDLLVETPSNGRRPHHQVLSGQADFGVGSRPRHWAGTLWPLYSEELLVVCAPDDPLRGRRVTPEDLNGRRWIRYDEDWPPFPDAGNTALPPGSVIRVPGVQAAVSLAARGAGLAAVPAGAVPPALRRHAAVPEPVSRREVVLLAAPGASAAVTESAALLHRSVRGIHGRDGGGGDGVQG